MKILKKLFLLCIPCMMFFSCESFEQRYVLSEVVPKSDACKYYEEKNYNILTVNDYKNGKYMVAPLDGSSSSYSFLTKILDSSEKENGNSKLYNYTVDKICPITFASGSIGVEEKRFSFTMLDYCGDDKKSTGKYSFKMVAEENSDVNNFITEDGSDTGNILSLTDEKRIFDPLVKSIVDSLKEQDIFNDKSAQPIAKKISGIDYSVYWVSGAGANEGSHYTTLKVDVPKFDYDGKSGSLYFYILQFDLSGSSSLVSVEGAIIYGEKKKFIYKDYDGKLKD